MARNIHGLSRAIPPLVKRAIRVHCSFGCVVCGGGIVQYEHVDPTFIDATEHDPNRMTLLCPSCHDKVTRGFWSKEKIKLAMLSPVCRSLGFSREQLDVGLKHPYIHLAGMRLESCEIPVMIDGFAVFQIRPPEQIESPYRLSALFSNHKGHESLRIIDNEWRAFDSNWDVESVGGSITITDAPQHISLKLVMDPPNGLIVEKMDMQYRGWKLFGNKDTLIVTSPGGGDITLTNCLASNCRVGLSLGDTGNAPANDSIYDDHLTS